MSPLRGDIRGVCLLGESPVDRASQQDSPLDGLLDPALRKTLHEKEVRVHVQLHRAIKSREVDVEEIRLGIGSGVADQDVDSVV